MIFMIALGAIIIFGELLYQYKKWRQK